MQEEEDFGGIGVAFCEGEQVKVVVADVEILASGWRKPLAKSSTAMAMPCRAAYIYALVRETRRDGGALFFGFGEEDRELFDGGHGDIASVIAG